MTQFPRVGAAFGAILLLRMIALTASTQEVMTLNKSAPMPRDPNLKPQPHA